MGRGIARDRWLLATQVRRHTVRTTARQARAGATRGDDEEGGSVKTSKGITLHAIDALKFLSETEAKGKILYRGEIRWKIIGYCRHRPERWQQATDTAGQVGNRFVILERLDKRNPKQPPGYRKLIHKQSFPPSGYNVEGWS